MTGRSSDNERIRREAADWLARKHAPRGYPDDAAFTAWLQSDVRHAAAFDRLERLWSASAGLAGTATGEAHVLRPVSRRRLSRRAIAFAGVAALAASVAMLVSIPRLPDNRPQVARSAIATSVGTIRRFNLADGSDVTLDTQTRLHFAISAQERRVVMVEGRARFDVAADAARPFRVETRFGTVTAIGTVFDVRVAAAHMDVSVIEGKVRVEGGKRGEPSGHHLAAVAAGEAASIAGGDARVMLAPGKAQRQWVRGMLDYRDASLAEVIEEAGRYSAVPIRLADPALGKRRVTGAFNAVPASELADALAAAFGLVAEVSPDGAIEIRSRK